MKPDTVLERAADHSQCILGLYKATDFQRCCFKKETVTSPFLLLLSPPQTILKYAYRNKHTHTLRNKPLMRGQTARTVCHPWEWRASLVDTAPKRHRTLKYIHEWDPQGQTWRRNIYKSHLIFLSLHKGEKTKSFSVLPSVSLGLTVSFFIPFNTGRNMYMEGCYKYTHI